MDRGRREGGAREERREESDRDLQVSNAKYKLWISRTKTAIFCNAFRGLFGGVRGS